jgi:hypothetical protein
VIDPVVAVVLGMTMIGERTAATAGVPLSLVGFAILGLSAALCLAQRYPQGSPAERDRRSEALWSKHSGCDRDDRAGTGYAEVRRDDEGTPYGPNGG